MLEVSVAKTLSGEVNNKPFLLIKVLVDIGCTRTIIKKTACRINFWIQETTQWSFGQQMQENSSQNTIYSFSILVPRMRSDAKN
jgi:hypothetical protein